MNQESIIEEINRKLSVKAQAWKKLDDGQLIFFNENKKLESHSMTLMRIIVVTTNLEGQEISFLKEQFQRFKFRWQKNNYQFMISDRTYYPCDEMIWHLCIQKFSCELLLQKAIRVMNAAWKQWENNKVIVDFNSQNILFLNDSLSQRERVFEEVVFLEQVCFYDSKQNLYSKYQQNNEEEKGDCKLENQQNQDKMVDENEVEKDAEELLTYSFGQFMQKQICKVEQWVEDKETLNFIKDVIQKILMSEIINKVQLKKELFQVIWQIMVKKADLKFYHQNTFNNSKQKQISKEYLSRTLDYDFTVPQQQEIKCTQDLIILSDQKINSQPGTEEYHNLIKLEMNCLLMLASINARSFKKDEVALNYLKEAFKLNCYDPDIIVIVIMIIIERKKSNYYEIASYIISILAEILEDSWRAYYLASWLLAREKKNTEAIVNALKSRDVLNYLQISYFSNTSNNSKQNAGIYLSYQSQLLSALAFIYFIINQKQLAEYLSDESLRCNIHNIPIVYLRRSRIDQEGTQGKLSFDWLQKAQEIDPNISEIPFDRGYSLIQIGTQPSFEKAQKLFQTCIEMEPFYIEAYINLACCYNLLNQIDLEKEILLAATKLSPNNHLLLTELGLMFYRQNDLHNSCLHFKKALEFTRNALELYSNIGNVYYLLKQYVNSQYWLKKYLEKGGGDVKNELYLYAYTSLQEKDFEQGEIQVLQSLISYDEDICDLFNQLLEGEQQELEQQPQGEQYEQLNQIA